MHARQNPQLPEVAVTVLAFALAPRPASAQDAQICFDAADKVTDGGKLEDAERQAAHEACQRALAETSSVVQKYQLQEADFDVTGTRPKQ